MDYIGKGQKRMDFIPGKMIIRIKEEPIRSAMGAGRLRMALTEAARTPAAAAEPLDYLRANAGLMSVTPVFSKKRAQLQKLKGGRRAAVQNLSMLSSVHDSRHEALTGINILSFPQNQVTDKLERDLNSSAIIEFAERMPARWLAGPDPHLNLQWGLRAIRWFDAALPDANQVKVAVLDSGIDRKHPELKDMIDDYNHEGNKPDDIIGHGTHVAGIIVSAVNDDMGVAGVANCRILVWKIFSDKTYYGQYYVDFERYLQALSEVIDAGVKVVNLSIGGTSSSQAEAHMFQRLTEHGITAIAAMGNEYEEGNPVEYPAGYPEVIAVGAVSETSRRAGFSCTGDHICLVAPGVNILSVLPQKKSACRGDCMYAAWNGTSMAAPHVAGAVALLYAKSGAISPANVAAKLRSTSRRLPEMRDSVWTSAYGSGLLDVSKLLA
jgi:subtilisin family serine protease